MVAPKVGLLEIRSVFDLSRKHATTDRTVSNETYPELTQRGENLFFNATFPKRVFTLNRRDWMHGMGTADDSGTYLRKTDVADLACLDEVGERSNGFFNWGIGI